MSGNKLCWTECCEEARKCGGDTNNQLISAIRNRAYALRPAGTCRLPNECEYARATLEVALRHCGAW